MSAIISDCGLYRYRLSRSWRTFNGAGMVLWVMLNPSTADAEKDDPTITRCIGYAKAWGFAGIMVGNLYAFRATDPEDLWDSHQAGIDIVGPDNTKHVGAMAAEASLIVCAWGGVPPTMHVRNMESALRSYSPLHCIGNTKNGQPWHPLYKSKHLKPKSYQTHREGEVKP